jgi:hypothetical protein
MAGLDVFKVASFNVMNDKEVGAERVGIEFDSSGEVT